MSPFRKSSPELTQRFGELAALVPDADRKQMFGYPTCVYGGNMFMGLHEESMILRLSEDDRTRFRQEHGGGVFEPKPGRPMREFVVVPPSLVSHPAIQDWVDRSMDYARQLPAKKAKPRKASRPTRTG
jgi:TfoX/Sxy family transcriptional regulator of competence genes